jgi:predicted alpha/beta hydrolase
MGFFSNDDEDWRSKSKKFDDDMSLEEREKLVAKTKIKKIKKPIVPKKTLVKPSGLSASNSFLNNYERNAKIEDENIKKKGYIGNAISKAIGP